MNAYNPTILFKAVFNKSGKTYLIVSEKVYSETNFKTGEISEEILWYSGYVERNGKHFGAYKTMKASDFTVIK
jgi:hypothetical protein